MYRRSDPRGRRPVRTGLPRLTRRPASAFTWKGQRGMRNRILSLLGCLVVLTGTARAQAPAPAQPVAPVPAPALANVEVFPADINLNTSRGRQSFVVKATFADGLTRDVTVEAKATFANPALVKLEKNVLTPVADGATAMNVEYG